MGLRLRTRFICVAVLLCAGAPARAEVFHSRDSGLESAFPTADTFETTTMVLDADQAQRIEARSRTKLASQLVRAHVARRRGGEIVGYGYFETHTVRSLPETILVAVAPDGRVLGVHLLAFHEPPEYLPTPRWLEQFGQRRLDDDLSLRRGIAGMSGSTLTAQSITAAVRRILAIHEVMVPTAPLATAQQP